MTAAIITGDKGMRQMRVERQWHGLSTTMYYALPVYKTGTEYEAVQSAMSAWCVDNEYVLSVCGGAV